MPKKIKAKISPQTVTLVAKVAHLHLSDEEVARFSRDLTNILAAFKDLDKAPTGRVEPSFQPLPVKDVFRDDEIEKSTARDVAMANTPHKEKGFFKGPKVI